MANILFIAYDYPPILSPESIQVQRRALTLAQNGHKVFILTSHDNPFYEFIDGTLIETHKNIQVFKTEKTFFEKSLNLFFKYFDLTDRKYWWRWFAINKAKKIFKKYNIDILYTHSTPLVDHIVGLDIKKAFSKVKWIAHFSDPWTLNPYKQYKSKIQFHMNRKLEKKVMKSCDILTVTSIKTKGLFIEEFNFLKNKIHVLPHTFDKKKYFKGIKKLDKKVVVHTGNIYGLRTLKYFLEALRELDLQNYEFHFYGKVKMEEISLVEEYNLKNVIKIYSQISYLESLHVISNADYLMVVDAPLKSSPFFPSKLADYIGAKKPIIALTPKNSATCDILNSINNNKMIASSDSVNEIKKVLLGLENKEKSYTNIDFYSMDNYNLLKEVFEK